MEVNLVVLNIVRVQFLLRTASVQEESALCVAVCVSVCYKGDRFVQKVISSLSIRLSVVLPWDH